MAGAVQWESLRLRLSLLFAGIAVAGLGIVYVAVVPGLRASLVDDKLRDLRAVAARYAPELQQSVGSSVPAPRINRLVSQIADEASARVTVLLVVSGTQLQLTPLYDSFSDRDLSGLDFPAATLAVRTRRVRTGTEASDTGRVGEVAIPLISARDDGSPTVGNVVVFSAPVRDAERAVSVVAGRVLAAAGVALALALLAGSLVARALTRRVARLERVAESVASGDFTTAFPVDRDDELGRLAATLEDMRGQLAELDNARKRFIATASHELRTPIFSLGGFLELIQDEDLDPETRERFLTQVRLQVDRLGKLATDLLDLSKLEAGSLELRPELSDIGLVAQAVASEFEPRLAAHDSHLELRLPGGRLRTVCDPERVGQVLRILIDNALTHTPHGTDMVVSASRRDGTIHLGVADFGPGIPRTMLPNIFEPFFTTDDAQGSGLGLAIAHELAERMDGDLVAESRPGRTTFTLELPA
ncbi:HAMP domain-containing histidine kinase [Paraconexibacter antarcticus]|uniref:histidine kinase n=1 Tax=Paraconexibacter antarcticus TaxID=2949664 RepID=A0ABY5DRA2_9ACTN|nr:HAMP domain-containing sensor histidine kinase [Paraconexibacter antarcticus]UTI64553.1 HAMP domain-containing histidine kinase [Paraconexibacter antarcticus]